MAGWEEGLNLHIDGGEGTVGDGAADSAGKGESGVEGNAGKLAGGVGLGLLDDSVNLSGSHCEYVVRNWTKEKWTKGLSGEKRSRNTAQRDREVVFFFFGGVGKRRTFVLSGRNGEIFVRPFFRGSGATAGTTARQTGNLSFGAGKIGSGLLGYPRLRLRKGQRRTSHLLVGCSGCSVLSSPKAGSLASLLRKSNTGGGALGVRPLGKISAWLIIGRPRFTRAGFPRSPVKVQVFHTQKTSIDRTHCPLSGLHLPMCLSSSVVTGTWDGHFRV